MVTKIEKKDGTTLFMKKKEAMFKFEDLMAFQYGEREESDLAFNRLTEDDRSEQVEEKKSVCTNECVLESSCKGAYQEECSGPVLPGTPEAKKYEVHDK